MFYNSSRQARQLLRQLTRMSSQAITTESRAAGLEAGKRAAASRVVQYHITKDAVIGIGSGSTMVFVLESLAERVKLLNLKVKCIPSSIQAERLIYKFGLPITTFEQDPVIHIAFDGADECNPELVAIKGGGACLTREKIVANASEKFIIVCDSSKDSEFIGQRWTKGIPIEVIPLSVGHIRRRVSEMFETPESEIILREGKDKAGPVVTDNGNWILDWRLDCSSGNQWTAQEWKTIADQVKLLPGVVEVGIFACMAQQAWFGDSEGNVTHRDSSTTGRY